MKKLVFLFTMIFAIGFSSYSQYVTESPKLQKAKYSDKTLTAIPITNLESQLEGQSGVIDVTDIPTLKKNRPQVKKKASKPNGSKQVLKEPKVNIEKLKSKNVRPQKSVSPITNTSKSAENIQTLLPNSYKSVTNVTIAEEDFDVWPVSGWLMYNGTSSTSSSIGEWHQGVGSTGLTGDNSPQILYDNGLMSDEWLVSPAMSLPTLSTIEMSFDWLGSYYWHVAPYDGADNPVLISTNGGVTWQSAALWQEDNSAQVIASGVAWPWSDFVWNTSTVDLSSFAGMTNVKIAFRYIGNDGAQWNIDNFEVYTVTTTTTGDDCSSAISVSGTYPITGSGLSIQNYTDDYSTALITPYGYDGPDMVYSFTPTISGDYNITFDCDYENVLAVFTSCTSPSTTQVLSADDNWTVPFSETAVLSAIAGTTYYIVNAAYELNATGNWSYTIDFSAPCVDNLITVGTSEIEPNGGLNATPNEYDYRTVGSVTSPTLIYGNYFTIGDTIRDMDWFNFTITQQTIITATVDVDCTDPIIFIVSDSTVTDAQGNVTFVYYFDANFFGSGMGESLTTTPIPAGDYWLVVAPNTFAGIPTPINYNATLYGESGISTLLGDVCSNPILLTGSLPLTGSGLAIEDFANYYSNTLTTPYGYTGGDVVYEFTPALSGYYDITFDCDFDNVLTVFTNCTDPAASQMGAADDNFNVPYTEHLHLTMTAGVTYYILNSAYSAIDIGDWTFTINISAPCVDNLFPIGNLEIEPNGGLNEWPVQYNPLIVGTPVLPTLFTGNYFTVGDSIRDMDWFNFTTTQEMIITATVDVECTDPVIWIISNDSVFDNTSGVYEYVFVFSSDLNGPTMGESLVTPPIPAGDYWFVIAPSTYSGISTPVNYNATLGGEATGGYQYLYYEDFQDGMPSDITLYDIDGNTPSSYVATYTQAWNIIENFDELGDTVAASNSWYTPPGTANDWLVTPAITIGSDAILKWDIKAQDPSYPDGYQVKISTTGTSPSSFTTTIYSATAANSYWETQTINLSSAGFTNTTIWIAFINNSSDMFILLLDDIKVYVPYSNDVAVEEPYFSPFSGFSIVPLSQAGFTFGALADNVGSGTLSNIVFSVDVLGNSYSESITIPNLAPNSSVQASINVPFVPTDIDTYEFYFTMDVAGDNVLGNNEELLSIEISDTIMARDNGTPAGGVGFAGATGHFGNVFEIINTTTLSSVSAYFSSAEIGETFSFTLFADYNYSANTVGLPVFTSSVYTKSSAMASNWSTFDIPQTVLVPGNYLLVVNQLSTINLSLGYDNEDGGFLIYYTSSPSSLVFLNSFGNNMLRMNFSNPIITLPNWSFTNTGSNHTILVGNNIPITIDGVPISIGDYLGVFFDQGGVESCGGFAEFTGSNVAVSAWGADTGMDDGFESGETFNWRIWDVSTGLEYSASATYNTASFPNNSTYITNGMSGLNSLIALTIETQSISLPFGWSIMSTYIEPFEPNIDSLFNQIISNVQLVKNQNGDVYWPEYFINAIGNIVIGEGYQVKALSPQVLEVSGLSVDPLTTSISLGQGWGILGYLHQVPANIVTMMASIVTDIQIVKNGNGQVYWPQWNVNGIGNMMPGEGYQIKLYAANVFSYPALIGPVSKSQEITKPVHFKNEINTGNNMTIGFPNSVWNHEIEYGDEIAAFNEDMELIGSAVYDGNNIALSIWGMDDLETSKYGIEDGKLITFKLWDNASGEEHNLEVIDWLEGDGYYHKDGISVANSVGIDLDNQLYQNFPNPFSGSTEIKFLVNKEGIVKIELFDLLGNHQGLIYSQYTSKGVHTLTLNSHGLNSGVYFYRMQSPNLITTKSLTIQK